MLVLELVRYLCSCFFFFFFKQKTAYEMRISDWSSDVCSSDLLLVHRGAHAGLPAAQGARQPQRRTAGRARRGAAHLRAARPRARGAGRAGCAAGADTGRRDPLRGRLVRLWRSEEHTSELQSLMRISYAVFCLKQKTTKTTTYRYADL